MSRDLAELLPEVRTKAEALLEAAYAHPLRIMLKVTHTYRTPAEQDALYAKGRTVPGEPCRHTGEPRVRPIGTCQKHPMGLQVTKAASGQSWHEFRRAFDVAIASFEGDKTPKDWYDGPWLAVGEVGESVGLEWGGRWTGADTPHFQHRGGMNIGQARKAAGLA